MTTTCHIADLLVPLAEEGDFEAGRLWHLHTDTCTTCKFRTLTVGLEV